MDKHKVVERTLVLIKPDVTQDKRFMAILNIYRDYGFNIKAAKIVQMDRNLAETLYQEHVGRDYFDNLIEHMISAPLIALMLEGENAIKRARLLNGATNPIQADAGTIRGRFGEPNGGPRNAVHASADFAAAERELSIFFVLPSAT